MRQERFGITFLLGLLLLFSSLVGVLHAQDSAKKRDGLSTLSNDAIIESFLPYIQAESVEQ